MDTRRLPNSVGASGMPTRPRASDSLSTFTSSVSSAMPCMAARMAMAVAAHEAMPARNSQPGLEPAPPIGSGMSVMAQSAPGPDTSQDRPLRQIAVAAVFGLLA